MAGQRANIRTVSETFAPLVLAEEACRELGWDRASALCAELRRNLGARVMMETGDGGEDFQRAQEAFHGFQAESV